jgi:predicted DsbA family dithiol-disulfide isomerase
MIKLDIFSDPICPWCFIGKAHLDRALESRPNHPFTIEWHPFQLNPEMPEGGMDRRAYLEGKFGGKENAIKAYMPVAEHAENAGLKMNLEGIKTTPNTINAHRLIHWAGIEGVQTPIVSALFKAYFIEGRDIGDIDVLADVADTGGMDAAVTRKLLLSDADLAARNMGINSVPTFIVAGQHAVPGAQPPELWQRVIDDVLDQLAQAE